MSEALNITKAAFGGLREVTTAPLWQYDYGQILQIDGLDLPQAFEVHFSNSRKSGETVTQIGTDNQVVIPDMYLTSGADIYAFVFLHDGTDDGETEYVIKIPVRERPEPSDIEPTPEQQDAITEAIAALNVAVTQTAADVISADASATAAAQSATNAQTAAQSAQGSATSASASATTASASAATATTKAGEAATSAANAASAKTAAETAQGKAEAAKTASESAQASAQSAANTATSKASEASTSATNASGSASAASASATAASESATQAAASATSASGSATAAAGSATTASTKASEASASATAANSAKTDAQAAQTAAETAKTAAEAARDETVTEAASIRDLMKDKADIIISNAEGAIATFNDGGDDMPMVSCVAEIEPVQDLHGQDAPYPAGGGKNLFDASTFPTTTKNGITCTNNGDGSFTLTGTATGLTYIDIFKAQFFESVGGTPLPVGSYRLTGCPSGGSVNTYYMYITPSYALDRGSGITNENTTVTGGSICIASGYTCNNLVFKPMIRISTNGDDAYAPYSNICPITGWTGCNVVVSPTEFAADGTTYPISWQSEAGTVYGGTLDVVSGVLTVTHGEIDSYAGETLPSAWISDRDVYLEGTTPTTGAQVVYELATPQTYQLTSTEVRTLLGLNNVWVDTGDTAVEYRADTRLYIEKLTQPEEYDMIADSAITSGKFFMIGNTLYRALANIASGATITVGTNATKMSLSDALNALA